MKKLRWLFVLLLLLLLLWLFFFRSAPTVSPTSSPKITPAVPPRAGAIPHAEDPRGKIVDQLLKKNRARIGACLMSSQESRLTGAWLVMSWDALGNATAVSLKPDLGDAAAKCLKNLIDGWKLPISPDLKSLSVTKKLDLRLR